MAPPRLAARSLAFLCCARLAVASLHAAAAESCAAADDASLVQVHQVNGLQIGRGHTDSADGARRSEVEAIARDRITDKIKRKDSNVRKVAANASSSGDGHKSRAAANESSWLANVKHSKHAVEVAHQVDVQIHIASSRDLVASFLLLFGPLGLAWAYLWCRHLAGVPQDRLYSLLLQVTVAAANIANLLVNQSLSGLMRSPMALTSLQALGIGATLGAAALIQGLSCRPSKRGAGGGVAGVCRGLYVWLPAALGFCLFQVADHLVSNYCSLSERTVFGNLSPIFALLVELALVGVVPPRPTDGASASFGAKLAMSTTVIGAGLFVSQYPDFRMIGVAAAAFFLFSNVVYRISQRLQIDKTGDVPTLLLASFDAFVLFLTSFSLSLVESRHSWTSLNLWLHDPAIVQMLILSFFSIGLGHFSILMMMRSSTATSVLVVNNISSSICVIQGIYFFGDNDFKSPLTITGILISIVSGFWYAAIQERARGVSNLGNEKLTDG